MKGKSIWDMTLVELENRRHQYWDYRLWGALVVSDRPLDIESKPIKMQLIEVKVQVDRYDVVAGLFIIRNGKVKVYPIPDDMDTYHKVLENIGEPIKDYYETDFEY